MHSEREREREREREEYIFHLTFIQYGKNEIQNR